MAGTTKGTGGGKASAPAGGKGAPAAKGAPASKGAGGKGSSK